MQKIQNLSKDNFSPYGTIIDYTDAKDDGWEIIVSSQSEGWRIALLEIERQTTSQLEYHPKSKESFEPISGTILLIVASYESPDQYQVFLLDRPVCLDQEVWHQVICLSESATMKITENLEVACVYHGLDHSIEAMVK